MNKHKNKKKTIYESKLKQYKYEQEQEQEQKQKQNQQKHIKYEQNKINIQTNNITKYITENNREIIRSYFANYTKAKKLYNQNSTQEHFNQVLTALEKISKKQQNTQLKTLDGKGNINAVITHIRLRFLELKEYLDKNENAIVVIPGDANTNETYLGKGPSAGPPSYASIAWTGIKPDGKRLYERLLSIISKEIKDLQNKYQNRIFLGNIGVSKPGKPPNEPIDANHIHVWGANAGNWNLNEGVMITGGGQAAVIGKQGPGVYGIVTMPVNRKEEVESILDVKPIEWELKSK